MLLQFFPESWKLGIIFVFYLLLISFGIFTIINLIGLRNKNKNQKILSTSALSVFLLTNYIFNMFLFSSHWKTKPSLIWFDGLSYFIYAIITLAFFYTGIITALIYKKTKKIAFLVWGLLVCFLSVVGFGLSLFKVLQMFDVIA